MHFLLHIQKSGTGRWRKGWLRKVKEEIIILLEKEISPGRLQPSRELPQSTNPEGIQRSTSRLCICLGSSWQVTGPERRSIIPSRAVSEIFVVVTNKFNPDDFVKAKIDPPGRQAWNPLNFNYKDEDSLSVCLQIHIHHQLYDMTHDQPPSARPSRAGTGSTMCGICTYSRPGRWTWSISNIPFYIHTCPSSALWYDATVW